jgi:peptidyl-prolyl cis-trans isomerase SurA
MATPSRKPTLTRRTVVSRNPAQKAFPTRDTLHAKLNLLDQLIVQEILLGKARAAQLDVPETEVDTAYANAKKGISDEAFQQELTRRGLTTQDVRDGLKRDLLSQKMIDKEAAKVEVTDKEVTAFFDANRARFSLPEEAYHIAQIVHHTSPAKLWSPTRRVTTRRRLRPQTRRCDC